MNSLTNGYGFGGVINYTLPNNTNIQNDIPLTKDNPNDHYWMRQALITSMSKVGISPPNPTVGCVLVKNNRMIAKGATQSYGNFHAEREAISKVKDKKDLIGATAYVTLEPCSQFGKQPPCCNLLADAGISRCVISIKDPFIDVNGKGIAYLKQKGISVSTGELASETLAWNYPFIAHHLYKRPIIFAKWAQTIDGHLADDENRSKWITSKEARSYTHWLRQKYDAIMVGAGTLIADIPSLNVRDCAKPINRDPTKILFDPNGRVLSASSTLRKKLIEKTFTKNSPIIYAISKKALHASDDIWIKKLDINLFIMELSTDTPIEECLDSLNNDAITQFLKLPLQSIFVEGGPTLLTHLLRQDRIDCFHTFIAPSFMGGIFNRIGRINEPIAGENRDTNLNRPVACSAMKRYKLMAVNQLGADIVMEYIPKDRFQRCFQQ